MIQGTTFIMQVTNSRKLRWKFKGKHYKEFGQKGEGGRPVFNETKTVYKIDRTSTGRREGKVEPLHTNSVKETFHLNEVYLVTGQVLGYC